MSSKHSKSYAVGYKKPPAHSRFQPGVSGNPRGKAKGAVSFQAALDRELNTLVDIKEGGKTRKVTKRLALAKQYLGRALQGDERAFARILPLILALDSGKELQQAAHELSEADALILKRNARRMLASLLGDDGDDE